MRFHRIDDQPQSTVLSQSLHTSILQGDTIVQGRILGKVQGRIWGGVGGVHPSLRTESALFPCEFSVKQCRKSALNYRNTPPPPPPWDE